MRGSLGGWWGETEGGVGLQEVPACGLCVELGPGLFIRNPGPGNSEQHPWVWEQQCLLSLPGLRDETLRRPRSPEAHTGSLSAWG